MTLYVKWLGIDMGECRMEVTPRRGHLLTGDTTKALGQTELNAKRCHRWEPSPGEVETGGPR